MNRKRIIDLYCKYEQNAITSSEQTPFTAFSLHTSIRQIFSIDINLYFVICIFFFSVCKSRVAFSLHLFIHFGLLLVDRTIRIYFVVALHIRRECILISSTFFSFFFILIHLDVALAHCSFATVVNPLFRSGFFFLFIISVLLRYTMY